MRKRTIILLLGLLCVLNAFAQTFEYSGIKYKVLSSEDKTVQVSSGGNYTGNIVIPSRVIYEGDYYDVTSIGYTAFYNCGSLTSVVIPTGLTSIGNNAFYLSGITSIDIPATVTSIGSSAFASCGSLTSITIPEGVVSIGNSAFYNCSSLTSITIPASVTSVGSGILSGCNGLNYIYISSTTPPSFQLGFLANTNNCPIYVPDESVQTYKTTTGWSDYSNRIESILQLKSIIPNDEIWYTTSDDNALSPVFTDVFGAQLVSNTYQDGQGILHFNNPVTQIGNNAFYGLTKLTSIIIPESVVSIKAGAFAGCSSLTSIIIEELNTVYDSRNNCNAIIETATNKLVAGCSTTIIPEEIGTIGEFAFSGCSEIVSIVIPEGVSAIERYTFSGCSNLSFIILPEGLGEIENGTFYNCSELTSIVIPEGLTDIGDSAFCSCGNLDMFVLPESVTSIGNSAFEGCNSLTSIIIPENVTEIGTRSLSACNNLYSITVEYGNNVYDSRNGCNAIIETATNKLIAGCSYTVIPNSVTAIGDYAFSGYTNLNAFSIPESVTSIGSAAFSGCTDLDYITILSTIPPTCSSNTFQNTNDCPLYVTATVADTYITAQDWSNYSNRIRPITAYEPVVLIPNNVIWYTTRNGDCITPYAQDVFGANIVSNVYENGKGIISFDAPVTSIGDVSFYSCNDLTSIVVPEGVTSIGSNAFSYCSNLTSITISPSVTSISYSAFSGCRSLTSITIPSGVTSIGRSTFSGCSNLTSITIPIGVTSIGSSAFSGCSNLTSITIPIGVTSIGSSAFSGCSKITSITMPEGMSSIGMDAFYGCSGLTSITIPACVTSIGSSAFYGCSGLTSITIPACVTSIGSSAFSGCSSLNSIIVEAGNSVYDSRNNSNAIIESSTNELVAGCKNTVIPESVTSIGNYAFYNCYDLSSITIPETVTSIGRSAFSGCSGLTSIMIPTSVTSIGNSTFSGCSGLTSIIIPTGVTSIDNSAFSNCSGLSSITIPASVTSINHSAFSGCNALNSIIVEIGNSVYDSRNGCDAIIESSINELILGCKNTIIPESVTSIGSSAFSGCSGMTSITIPSSVTSIGNYAFSSCSGLTSITIPESVTSIGSNAFYNCSGLASITIPSSITSIGNSAFSGCNLSYVIIMALTPPVCEINSWSGNNIFNGSYPLYVSEELVQEYQTADGWNDYADRIMAIPVVNPNDSHPNNEIWYTSTDGNVITPSSQNGFGARIVSNVYENDKGIITFDFPVTSIGANAFFDCSGLTSITIPESVSNIGGFAFYNCSGLTSITIPESVSNIGSYAFYNCYGLTTITIPSSVTSIGGSAFAGCVFSYVIIRALTPPAGEINSWYGNNTFNGFYPLYVLEGSVQEYKTAEGWDVYADRIMSIPVLNPDDPHPNNEIWYTSTDGNVITPYSQKSFGARIVSNVYENGKGIISFEFPVTCIGNYAFYNCSGLTSITIPESVINIGDYAFYNCSGLTSITIPESVISIGNSAFSNCSGLTSITIPECITSIGNTTFYGCSGLTSITIPETVTSIGERAFSGCRGLTSITIPASVTNIGSYAFYDCSGLASIIVEAGNSAYNSRNGCNAIINTPTNELVVGCDNTVIPEGVTSIGNAAFYNCRGFIYITIPDGVTSIGNNAFYSCYNLTSITIPASVTSIGYSAFSRCSNLSYVMIRALTPPVCETNTSEGNNIFNGSYTLYVPEESVQEYKRAEGWDVYADRITAIPVLNPDDSHPNNEIWYTSTDGNVITPHSQNGFGARILSNVYENGKGIITFDFPVTGIGNSTFSGFSSLMSITIPESVTSIGSLAFSSCSGLTSIVIEEGNTVYDSRNNCNAIIESSTNELVAGCKNTVIPESVTSIGSYAFNNCNNLTAITIPESVTSIGYSAFTYCDNLSYVMIKALTPPLCEINEWGNNTFLGSYPIYVPEESVQEYKIAEGWDDYADRIKAIPVMNPDDPHPNNEIWYTSTNGNVITPNYQNGFGANIVSNVYENGKGIITFDFPVTCIGDKTFYYCDGLTSITIPESVTSIGNSAFYYCYGITSMTIPESVTSIGKSAFYACRGISSITIPEGVISIGSSAFYDCRGLTSITIPEGVTSIGNSAFYGCRGLTSITIPEGVTSIGNSVFYGCSGLTSITIPAGVTSINPSAFSGCSGLTSINVDIGNSVYDSRNGCNAIIESSTNELVLGCNNTVIPEGVISIGSSAFSDCRGLTTIVIPEGVTSIGNSAFYGCSGLTSITIPEGVTSIGNNAFNSCGGLISITIPSSVTSIGNYAFSYCNRLSYVLLTSTTPPACTNSSFWGYYLYPLYVPEELVQNYKTADGWDDYVDRIKAIPIVNPNDSHPNNEIWYTSTDGTVITPYYQNGFGAGIVSNVYENGKGIITFDFPVTDIGYSAFSGCSGLTSITIPESVTSIGSSAFYGCSGLTSITIPKNVTSIGSDAFSGCIGLTSITIPAGLTTIDHSAFSFCSGLTSIDVESGNSVYDSRNECNAIINTSTNELVLGCKNTVIPESVTGIGSHAFSGCSGLTSITIPENVTSIGSYAFSGCSGLTSITIPKGVTSFGDYSVFCDCSGLTSITIPEGVTSIGNSTFYNCSGLTSIKIPEGVTSIDNYAFSGCSGLASITIPENVTSIGNYAFTNCNLSYVMMKALIPPVLVTNTWSGNNASFDGSYPLYVSEGLVQEYQTADVWGNYADRIMAIPLVNPNDSHPNNEIWYTSTDGNVITPYSQKGFGASIISNVYENGKGIITFEIPVTSLGSGAFNSNDFISITIPESVTSISSSVFSGCGGLTSISIEVGNTVYDSRNNSNAIIESSTNELVAGCKNTVIPESVTSIGSYAFSDCCGLTSFTIPACVTSIGDYSFSGCSGLTSIEITEGVTSIGNSAFYNCNGLMSITIPESVSNIGSYSFYGCSGLTSIIIPESVTNIGTSAFRYLNLSYVVIKSTTPPLCTSTAFRGSYPIYVEEENVQDYRNADGWSYYTNRIMAIPVVQPDDPHPNNEIWYTSSDGTVVTPYSQYFYGTLIISNTYENGKGIIKFDYPVTSISSSAFYDCSSLTSITLPESVTGIGSYAFEGCSGLTSITIPGRVTTIGDAAFNRCSNLSSVTIYSSVLNNIGYSIFADNASERKIYVFGDLVDYYRNNYYLRDYSYDIEYIPDLNTNDAGDGSGRWCTYYNGYADVRVDDYTTIYKATLNGAGNVTLTEIPGHIIKKGEAVLLNTPVSGVELYSGTWVGDVSDYQDNELKGVDVSTPQSDGVAYYVLSKVNDQFGFYRLQQDVPLRAGRAYMTVANSNHASIRNFLSIGGNDDSTTEIKTVENKPDKDAWYTIYGQKLDAEPTESGMYIHNGHKVLIK